MKTLFFNLLALAVSINALAQDDLVTFEDIAFSSPFEQTAFTDLFKNKIPEGFNTFMANGQALNENAIAQAASRFNEYVARLNSDKILQKKNDRKVKMIYDGVHETFLRKYELQNRFEDIFINGYYNCVSATALYALVFDQLKIPYVIKEKPTHVYLIAYPATERIIVETTTPAGGFVTINQQFKHSYVKILRDQKLISPEEYSTGNVNEMFDRFYFGEDSDITLKQLVGIQYSNEGIYHLQNKNSTDALNQFKKAYLFYPSERLSNLMLAAAHDVFKDHQAKDSVHAATLALLSRFNKFGITHDMIRGEYANVVQDLLSNKGEKEKLDGYHRVLLNSLKDKVLKEDIDFYYHYENGRILYNQARYKEAVPYFENCLNIRPGNQETVRIFIACVAESLKNKQNSVGIQILEEHAVRYPVLLENNVFNEMLGTAYLVEMRMQFSQQQPAAGEKFQSSFEKFQSAHSEVTFNIYLLGEAYSAAAVYYFRKGNTGKAKAILNKGLSMSPNNYELTTRKRMIE